MSTTDSAPHRLTWSKCAALLGSKHRCLLNHPSPDPVCPSSIPLTAIMGGYMLNHTLASDSYQFSVARSPAFERRTASHLRSRTRDRDCRRDLVWEPSVPGCTSRYISCVPSLASDCPIEYRIVELHLPLLAPGGRATLVSVWDTPPHRLWQVSFSASEL